VFAPGPGEPPVALNPNGAGPVATHATGARTRIILSIIVSAIFVFLLPGLGVVGAGLSVARQIVAPVHVALLLTGFVGTGLGITIGYHRLLTHRSFDAHPILKGILLVLGSMAVEGPAIAWVANHMKHHAFSDRPGDPHSPNEGFIHAHWGWLFDFSLIDVDRYAGHLARDTVARWISRTFVLWVAIGYIVPFAISGWEGLIWGGLLRQFAVQNVTFAVNSVCHRWGTRPFKTRDRSRNNWVVGILGLGEGWHNNHHAFPTSAFHGLRWWEVDLSGHIIRILEAARLVWNVKRPDVEHIRRRLFEPAAAPAYARVTE